MSIGWRFDRQAIGSVSIEAEFHVALIHVEGVRYCAGTHQHYRPDVSCMLIAHLGRLLVSKAFRRPGDARPRALEEIAG